MVRRTPPPPEAPSGKPVGAGRGPSQARVAAWLVAGALAATMLIGVAAGVLRTPVALDPASPEVTVQANVQAVLDGEVAVFDLVVEDGVWRISGAPWPIGHDGAGR